MGTYTANYNLFMPTVGETGWGTLVNTNFSTIDTTMKSLSNRITAVENEVNGNLSCTSVTASGTISAGTGTFTNILYLPAKTSGIMPIWVTTSDSILANFIAIGTKTIYTPSLGSIHPLSKVSMVLYCSFSITNGQVTGVLKNGGSEIYNFNFSGGTGIKTVTTVNVDLTKNLTITTTAMTGSARFRCGVNAYF